MCALTDEDLLCSEDPEAFGVFYDRHVRALLAYFARRTGDAEVAADLTAETFASAIDAAFGEDSVWVSDYTGRVIRIDPFARRVLARIPVKEPGGIAVGAGAAWVRT